MTINTRNPADMTGQERLQEIAAILANGVQRSCINKKNQCDDDFLERSLTGLPPRMKHSCVHAENQSGDK